MKKAIDIVLLPPEKISDFAIELNKPWVQGINDEIELNSKTCLPHITLAMGIMEENQFDDVKKIIEEIASQFSVLDLKINGAKTSERLDGRKMTSLEIEKTQELQKLHEIIMDKFEFLFIFDEATKEMFFSPPPVNQIPMWWVEGFVKTSVREKYWPHITLGMGVPENLEFPISFKASSLALCHLGSYCTCREILYETKLS